MACMRECYYDCISESDEDLSANNQVECECTCLPSVPKDPVQIYGILERAATNAKLLLNELGVHSDDDIEEWQHQQQHQQHRCFFPATLEISARLHTDAQCMLRGDPVTLKLPMELDPYSGQVNVNIFQPKPPPKPLKGVGAGDRCGCLCPSIISRTAQRRDGTKRSGRRVRWPLDV